PPAVFRHTLEDRAPSDAFEGRLVGSIDGNLHLVRSGIDEPPVVLPHPQQRAVRGRPYPDVSRARIADHREDVVALHQRLADALQFDLQQAVLFVDQAPEGLQRHVFGAPALRPVADYAHRAAEVAAADVLDIELDWQVVDLGAPSGPKVPFVI